MDEEKVVQVRNELNRVSDLLTEKIVEYEKFLSTIGFGVVGFTNITPQCKLGYGKYGGR